MERMLILNASPRAPRSHSRIYARMLADAWKGSALCQEVRPGCHSAIRQAIGEADALVLVFPLYADSLPVPLLRLFKELEACPPCRRPAVSVVVNCGFLEPFQNDIAVEMVRLFCRRNGYPFAAALEIASGEAILPVFGGAGPPPPGPGHPPGRTPGVPGHHAPAQTGLSPGLHRLLDRLRPPVRRQPPADGLDGDRARPALPLTNRRRGCTIP